MNIELVPKTILRYSFLFVGFLVLANVAVIMIKVYSGHDVIYGLIPLFDFDCEMNLPTLYSSFNLFACAVLLWLIGIKHREAGSSYIYWMGLAALFAFLAIDETAALHERLTEPVRESLNTSGLLFYGWVVPYGIASAVIGALYLRFLIRLPKRIRTLVIISAALFISGALGCELLGGLQDSLHGRHTMLFCLMYTLEELLEMSGTVVFIYALLSYITSEFGTFTATIRSDT